MWLLARNLTRLLFQCDAREHMEKGFPQMDEISLWKFEKRSGQGNRRKDGPQQYIGKEGGSMPAGMPSKGCRRGEVRRNIRERRTHVGERPSFL